MGDKDNVNEIHSMTEKMAIPVQVQQKQPHRRLPRELECEIFKCLKLSIQQKFIWGFGRGIYEMLGHKLLTKSKKLRNPISNQWKKSNSKATIAPDGLKVCNTFGIESVLAERGSPISFKYARMDHFPGTIIYYFEVTHRSSAPPDWECCIGFSDGSNSTIGRYPDCYVITSDDNVYISGERYRFEWPEGAIRPEWNGRGDVVGCGLVLNPKDELSIFFTRNARLIGKQIPINPSAPCLYPSVFMRNFSLEANFGDDPAKPFKYDIKNCPGLGLACI